MVGLMSGQSFFVNGRRLRGSRPLRAFRKIVEAEIKRAEALLAAGVPRADLYRRLMRRGPAQP